MPPEKNPLEIYQILPRTNCGQCFLPSCLAFSAAVISGERTLADCPFINEVASQQVKPTVVTTEPYAIMRKENLRLLQEEIAAMDFASAANRVGGRLVREKLIVTCLSKDFMVDGNGGVTSECHTHAGLTIPLLRYIIDSRGDNPVGEWVAFRELQGGPPMSALFEQRGEKRLQRLADGHTDLFDDLVSMFSGSRETNLFSSDISITLFPLPKLPVLICYWRPDEDLGSKLAISFDATADRHLPIESIFELCIGMVMMFEKIACRHM